MSGDQSVSALALVLDALFNKINFFKTEEELRVYLIEDMKKPKEERRKEMLKDLQKAMDEVQGMLKKTC